MKINIFQNLNIFYVKVLDPSSPETVLVPELGVQIPKYYINPDPIKELIFHAFIYIIKQDIYIYIYMLLIVDQTDGPIGLFLVDTHGWPGGVKG